MNKGHDMPHEHMTTVAAVPAPEEIDPTQRECEEDDERADSIARELEAIGECAHALRILSPEERARVLAYLGERFLAQ